MLKQEKLPFNGRRTTTYTGSVAAMAEPATRERMAAANFILIATFVCTREGERGMTESETDLKYYS